MNVLLALQIAGQLLAQGQALLSAATRAKSEGRDDLTREELQSFVSADDKARDNLQRLIDDAEGKERQDVSNGSPPGSTS